MQSNSVSPSIRLCAMSHPSPAVLVIAWTVPRKTLSSTCTPLAKRAKTPSANGSRLSSAIPRPSKVNPSIRVPLAALAPSAPGR